MKKATTIIRQIDDLERELWENYSEKQIFEAIEKEEKKKPFGGGPTGLINVIYTSATDLYEIDMEMEEE